MIILDTNVVSDLMRGGSAPVAQWLSTVAGPDLHTTAITRAEIAYGIARLPAGRRRDDLERAAGQLFTDIADRTVSFDTAAADRYGPLVAERERTGRPISVPDAQIASIALVWRASVATRNVGDFENCGVRVIDPWGGATGEDAD